MVTTTQKIPEAPAEEPYRVGLAPIVAWIQEAPPHQPGTVSLPVPPTSPMLGAPPTVAKLPGISKLSGDDLVALQQTADEIQTHVDNLSTIMSLESGFDPAARNPQSRATGIIQFMPGTARALGTDVDDLIGMSFQEQLPYVIKFYRGNGCIGVEDVGDLYVCTFCPVLRGKPDDYVVAVQGSSDKGPCGRQSKVYAQNSGLDHDKDGVLTAGDIKSVPRARLAAARGDVVIQPSPLGPKKRSVLKPLLGGAVAGGIIAFAAGWI